jgi:hypothetical protein
MFLLGLIGSTVTPFISWAIYHTDPTPHARNLFAMHYYLFLTSLYGFALGLIPTHKLQEALNSVLGNFASSHLSTPPSSEPDFTRPHLWAWLPVGTVFLLRFIMWQPPDNSVLATTSEGRFEHFFFPRDFGSFNLFSHTNQLWVFDRYLLTGPTLFLLAYSLGFWFRQQLPSNPDVQTEETSETN